tara:strand:- start:696 stop:869 length:174 start_codon:yes stop_codon:yes gene_type:complete
MKTVKKATQISKDLAQWLKLESQRSGASESSILATALNDYRDRKPGLPAMLRDQQSP